MAEQTQQRVVQIIIDSKNAEPAIKKLKTELQSAERSLDKVKTTAKTTGNVIQGDFGRKAGMAGIQISQLTGQIQGGQSAMLALSQQSADLGFVLGVPLVGVVVSLAAALGGTLLPELFKTNEYIKSINETSTLLAANYNILSDAQREVARDTLSNSIDQQKVAIASLNDEVVTSYQEFQQAKDDHKAFTDQLSGDSLVSTKAYDDALRDASNTYLQVQASVVAATIELNKMQTTLDGLTQTDFSIAAKEIKKLTDPIAKFRQQTGDQVNPFQKNIDAVLSQSNTMVTAFDQAEKAALANTLLNEEQKTIIRTSAAQLRAQMEIDIEREKGEAIARDQQNWDNARLSAAQSIGGSLMSIGQGQSKKLFEVGKALSLASAIASLPNAVMKSYENAGGYPWGIPAAAAMGAAGLAQIAQIKKTKYGSKSASGGTGGGGGASTTGQGFAPPSRFTQTENTANNELLNELRQWSGSEFIPFDVARKIAESLAQVQRQGGI